MEQVGPKKISEQKNERLDSTGNHKRAMQQSQRKWGGGRDEGEGEGDVRENEERM